MGGNGSTCIHKRKRCQEVCLAKHYNPVRNTQGSNIWQRHSVLWKNLQGFLRRIQDRILQLYVGIHPSQWLGWSFQQSSLRWPEKEAGKRKRQMGWGTFLRLMGLSSYTSAIDWRNTFFLGLLHGCGNPSENWPPYHQKRNFWSKLEWRGHIPITRPCRRKKRESIGTHCLVSTGIVQKIQ